MKKRICIITFSDTYRDPRVLRQIEYLSPHFDLTVLGFGAFKTSQNNVVYHPVGRGRRHIWKIIEILLLLLGKISSLGYELWMQWRPQYREALKLAVTSHVDVYHANDWAALDIAMRAARINGAQVVFDAHEYWPLEAENHLLWRIFFSPLSQHVMNKHLSRVNAFVTISPPIARRYQEEFGVDPIIVMNAPKPVMLPPHPPVNPSRIRLVNHGTAVRDRQLERAIKGVALADERFSLDFFLLETDKKYISELKAFAQRLAPDRIRFNAPVPVSEVLKTIAQYDIGIYVMAPINYNNHMALPNRFFDFIVAGLALCIGPSPAMAELTREHGMGWVCEGFEPADIAKTLNEIRVEDIVARQKAAHEAAKVLNADVEMAKLVKLYQEILNKNSTESPA